MTNNIPSERWGALEAVRIDRELAELKSLVHNKDGMALREWISAREQVIVSRLEAMDKAVMLLEKFPTAIDIAIGSLEKLHNQKLESIIATVTANKAESEKYVELIAEQTKKNSTDVDAAVKAAFAASTLAVTQQNIANALASDKQGAAFTKDIDKLTSGMAQILKNSDDKLEEVKKNNDQRVNDLKDRMGAMEARTGILDPSTAKSLADINVTLAMLQASQDRGEGGSKATDDNSKWIAIIAAIMISLAAIVVPLLERAH